MGDWLPQCNWIIFETKDSSYMRLDTEDDKKSIGRERESRSLQNGRKLEVESGGEERLLTFCCPSKKI